MSFFRRRIVAGSYGPGSCGSLHVVVVSVPETTYFVVSVEKGACDAPHAPHDRCPIGDYARWKYNACRSSTAGFEVCTVTSPGTSSSASE